MKLPKLIAVGGLALLVSVGSASFAQKKAAKAPADQQTNKITAERALTGVPMPMTPGQLPDQFTTQLRNDVANSKGTAILKQVGNDIEYTFKWENLTSPVTQAHFHYGPKAHVASRAFSICGVVGESPECPSGTSNSITGVWKNADIAAVKDGDIIIAFHTQKYPAPIGEIAVYIPGEGSQGKEAAYSHMLSHSHSR